MARRAAITIALDNALRNELIDMSDETGVNFSRTVEAVILAGLASERPADDHAAADATA